MNNEQLTTFFVFTHNVFSDYTIYIRRPLQSVERVRLHSKPLSKQPASQPASQQGKAARQPGSQAARQPGSQAARQSSPPGTQAAGIQDLGARMLRSYHLIILSSSIGDLLGCSRLPQAAKVLPGCLDPIILSSYLLL